jgi:hypothetical protein
MQKRTHPFFERQKSRVRRVPFYSARNIAALAIGFLWHLGLIRCKFRRACALDEELIASKIGTFS